MKGIIVCVYFILFPCLIWSQERYNTEQDTSNISSEKSKNNVSLRDKKLLIGKYKLTFNDAPSENREHYIKIHSIKGKSVKGEVGLDYSMKNLAEAREPSPFEKIHRIKFSGKLKNKHLIFKIIVAGVMSYEFNLKILEDKSKDEIRLFGYCIINSINVKSEPVRKEVSCMFDLKDNDVY